MATITKRHNSRLGNDYWAVTWGKGMTQTAIALTEAEAVALATGGRKTTADGCQSCGMAYSFFFGGQFHKAGCTEVPNS